MKISIIALIAMMVMLPSITLAAEDDYLFDKVNSVRAIDLVYSQDLEDRAQKYADDLCAANEFTTKNWTSYIAGLDWKIGVNLAKDFKSDKKMFKAFLDEEDTSSNIYEPLYFETGIARNEKCNIVIQFFN